MCFNLHSYFCLPPTRYLEVLLFMGEEWAHDLLTFYKRRTYCYRINDSVTFKFSVHPKSIGINLAAEHRKILPKYVDDYDIFLYHEDDIVFRFKHLVAFVEETKRLQNLLPEGERNDYGIGFLRKFLFSCITLISQLFPSTECILK